MDLEHRGQKGWPVTPSVLLPIAHSKHSSPPKPVRFMYVPNGHRVWLVLCECGTKWPLSAGLQAVLPLAPW